MFEKMMYKNNNLY